MAKGKAARGVLGNDPFLRGAAVRAPSDAAEGKAEAAKRVDVAEVKAAAKVAAKPVEKRPAKSNAKKPSSKKPGKVAAKKTRAEKSRVQTADLEKTRVETTDLETASVEPPDVDTAATTSLPEAELSANETFAPPRYAGSNPVSGPSFAHRASGALGIAREILIQALRNQRIDDIRRAARGLTEALLTAVGTAGSTELDAFGRDADLVEKLRPLTEFLYERYWRVHVEGAIHVPAGPVILVANHSGAVPYDGPVLSAALQRERPDLVQPRWLVEDQIFYAPFFGTLLNRLGAVRANPDNAVRLLLEGRPVLVFPEGFQALSKPYSERYQLKRFGRGGFVKIALRQGCPIVPVAVVGSEETTPLLAKLPGRILGLPYIPLTPLGPIPLPARWNIRFGEPIDVEGLGADAADDPGAVQRITDRTRESIQDLLRNLLRERTIR